jgi:thiamine biosynthesis lipoprotein ApbE
LADALATACFVLGPDAGRQLLETYPGSAALWLDGEGREAASDGWPGASGRIALPPASGFC